MLSFEQVGALLDEIAEEFPPAFYRELNGGISLLPEAKHNPAHASLYIMGEYHNDSAMGRYITIYYGSFAAVHSELDEEDLYDELYTVLAHEFTHHMESLAGERGLEVKDAEFLQEYLEDEDEDE